MGKGKHFLDDKSSKIYEPCVIVHGGAWSIPKHLQAICVEGVQAAARAGYGKLLKVNYIIIVIYFIWWTDF